MNVVINMDGVIRSETGQLITDGLLLYKIIKPTVRVVLISTTDLDRTVAWLAMNHISDYDDIITPIEGLEGNIQTLRQVAVARSYGEITYYIDADPAVIAETLRQGICSMLFVTPSYARPEWRPDAPKGPRRSWSAIVEEKQKQLAFKAADARLSKSEVAGYE
jgi:hypothetical protein